MIDHNSADLLVNLKTIQGQLNEPFVDSKELEKVLYDSRELLKGVRQIVQEIYSRNEVNRFD